MLTKASFDYAVIRVVPRVEREEFINIGVIVQCRERRFLEARIELDERRLRALWPALDLESLRLHTQAIVQIAAGDPTAGPIARLSQSERFHWLTSPRSTILQTSAVHTGICTTTTDLLHRIYRQLLA